MAVLALRSYQEEAIEKVCGAWDRGATRVAVVLPTGAGKTVMFAHLITRAARRAVVLAHRDELIQQAVDKLHAVAPNLRIGIYKADRRELDVDVVIASVQSLTGSIRREELARFAPGLVIVDECHHAVADTYMRVMEALGSWRGVCTLGVTATLTRGDRVALGQVWEEVAYRRDVVEMIRDGYLVPVHGRRVRVEGLDLASVARSGGDWTAGGLGGALSDSLAPQAVARAYVEHAKDRQGILFTPTVDLAYEMADEMNASGIVSEGLDGRTRLEDRRDLLARYARGDVQVIANCGVLTEGFDAPWCSCVVIARPTSSAGLFVQMAGRALRPWPGKEDALILDVVGVTGRHRLASVADLAGVDKADELTDEQLALLDDEDLEVDLFDLLTLGERKRTAGADGPLVSEVVDLFATRRQAWLRTRRGVWFLSAGEHLVFLYPGMEPGRYGVARCRARGRLDGEFLQEPCDLDMAMCWGEQHATVGSGVLVRRTARWRKGEPSDAQTGLAKTLSVPVDGMSKGDLSDMISIAFASRRLDGMNLLQGVTDRGYW